MAVQRNRSDELVEYTFPLVVTNSGSYETVGFFSYTGTDVSGIPLQICVISGMHDTGTVCGVRIYDHTNAMVIAENLTISTSSPTLVDLGTIGNCSSGNAVWEVQVKRVSGSGQKSVSAGTVSIRY